MENSNNTKTIPIIAIDGPSSSGKGTISQLVAERLQWHFLDSGAIYRVLALAVDKRGLVGNAVADIAQLAIDLQVQFKSFSDPSSSQVILDGADVTDIIRLPACSNLASKISIIPAVRTALLARQRAFCQAPGLVADGRDMGTVVFPEANLKIYLDADCEERARRRHGQLRKKGIHVSIAQILAELEERDLRDKTRTAAPLKPAADAIVVDTTALTIQQVFDYVMNEVQLRQLINA